MTLINSMPRKVFVFIMANVSNAFEIFTEKTCVIVMMAITNIANSSTEKTPTAEVIMKNQSENPSVTDSALNLGEDNSI